MVFSSIVALYNAEEEDCGDGSIDPRGISAHGSIDWIFYIHTVLKRTGANCITAREELLIFFFSNCLYSSVSIYCYPDIESSRHGEVFLTAYSTFVEKRFFGST
jgi:hypothetical protein